MKSKSGGYRVRFRDVKSDGVPYEIEKWWR